MVPGQLNPLTGLAGQVVVDQRHHAGRVRPPVHQVADLHHGQPRRQPAGVRVGTQPDELLAQLVGVPGDVADHRHPVRGRRGGAAQDVTFLVQSSAAT